MATADEYAQWIVANSDKKGTPEFETVAAAYREARTPPAAPYDVPAGVASAMNIGQSLTLGFGDEIAGKLGLDRDKYRATVDNFRQEYPGSAMLGSVSGGMLLPLGGAKVLSQMHPLAIAATTGGVVGAVQGVGDSENMQQAPMDAIKGTIAGMAMGPLAAGSMKPIGSIASAIGAKLPIVGEKLSSILARNRVADAFARDNVLADDVGRNMVGLGAEARIADGAGENTRGLLDLNANLPGKTKNDLESLIRNRIAERPERLDPAVYAVNGGFGRAGEVTAALTAQKLKESAPLYQQLHTMDVPVTNNLRSILTAAQQVGATGTAKKIAAAERVPFTPKDFSNKVDSLMNNSGDRVSMRDADLIKRGIDDLIEGQTDAVTGKVTTLGRSYVKLKKSLTDELDTLTTDSQTGTSLYKSARDAFAGPSALQSAIEKGRRVWNDDAEGIASTLSEMSASEQEAFRIGASEVLRTKFGSPTGQNQLLNQWKDRNVREKLQALIGDDAKYDDVVNMLRGEETLKRLESLGPSRNSRTFSREAGAEQQTMDNAADLIDAGLSVKTGGLSGLLGMVGKATTRIGTPEVVRDSIGNILMSKYNPETMKALLETQRALAARRSAAASSLGTVAGKEGKGLLDF